MRFTRLFYLALGWLFVGLGVVGIIMPILPTTPFLIFAVWAFSRSSPETAAKIRAHRIIGPYVREWEAHGVIPAKAKVLAVIMMTAASYYLIYHSHAPQWLAVAVVAGMVLVAVYILSRPSRPPA